MKQLKIYAKTELVISTRQEKGFTTQGELGKAIGKTNKTICNVETGKPVSTATAHKICVALGKKFNQLFEFRQGE